MHRVALLFLASRAVTSTAAVQQAAFATLGDWGGYGAGGWYFGYQQGVAAGLSSKAAEANISFVVNVGDSFYWTGVKSTADKQWKAGFEEIYSTKSLMVPWISALGNHDYGENPGCQTEYKSPNSDRWFMPARYYSHQVRLGSSQNASIIVLDTNPCISDYRSDNPLNWDPDAEEAPAFHKNIMNQTCAPQLAWFTKALAAVPKNDWLIVVGHHPMEQVDVEDFLTPLKAAKADIYLAGHMHLLEQYTLPGVSTPFVISGAGCMVHTDDKKKLKRVAARRKRLARTRRPDSDPVDPNIVWQKGVAGYTLHTFSPDFTKLTTVFYDNLNKEQHSFVANKQLR